MVSLVVNVAEGVVVPRRDIRLVDRPVVGEVQNRVSLRVARSGERRALHALERHT